MIEIEVDDRYLRDFIRFGKTKGKKVFYSKVIPELIYEKIIKISPEETGYFKSQWRKIDQGKGAIAFTNPLSESFCSTYPAEGQLPN